MGPGEVLSLYNSSVEILVVEREVNFNYDQDMFLYSIIALTLLVLPVNSLIIFWVKVIKDKTLIDGMILSDCVANIGLLCGQAFIYPKRVWDSDLYCIVQVGFRTFFVVLNRLIPVTIITYRYIMVCQVDFAEKIGKSRLAAILNNLTLTIPVLLSLAGIYFHNDIEMFLICRGKTEQFHYNLDDFFLPVTGGTSIKQPFYHPLRIVANILVYTYIAVVPLGYFKIYRFMDKHNLQVQGITNDERRGRQQRNLVTMGFNLSIWLLEVVVGVVYHIKLLSWFQRNMIVISLSCGITPILYIVGMSDVRDSLERNRRIFMKKVVFCCRKNNAVQPGGHDE